MKDKAVSAKNQLIQSSDGFMNEKPKFDGISEKNFDTVENVVQGKVEKVKAPSSPVNNAQINNVETEMPNIPTTSAASSNSESQDVVSDGMAQSPENKDTTIQETRGELQPNKNSIPENFNLNQDTQNFINHTTSVPKPKIVNNEKVIYEKSKGQSVDDDPFDKFDSGGVSQDVSEFFNSK